MKSYFKNKNIEVIEIIPLKKLKNYDLSYDQLNSFSSKDILDRKIIDTFNESKKEILTKNYLFV